MAIKAITVNTPAEAEPHITAFDDASINLMKMNGYNYPIGKALEFIKVSNTKIKIKQGIIALQGRYLVVDSDGFEIDVPSCPAGMNRKDLLTLKFDNTNITTPFTFKITVGTATTGTALAPALVTETQFTGLTESVFSMNLAYITFASAVLTTISTIQRPIYIENGDKWQLLKTLTPDTDYASISTVTESGGERAYPVPFKKYKIVIESENSTYKDKFQEFLTAEDFGIEHREFSGAFYDNATNTLATILTKLDAGIFYLKSEHIIINKNIRDSIYVIRVYGC